MPGASPLFMAALRLRWLAATCAVIAPLFAENGYEFQRAIEHQREFQRELDSYRSQPNPTRSTGGVIPESEIREWLEGRKAAANAWRDEEIARRRAHDEAREADRQARSARSASVERAANEWITRGFDPYDAASLAEGTVARPDGSYSSSENYRSAAERLEGVLRRFESALSRGDVEESLRLARNVADGAVEGISGEIRAAPVTAARCLDQVADRFPARRGDASNSAAYFYRVGFQRREMWSAASVETRGELIRRWARAAENAADEDYRGEFARAVSDYAYSPLFSGYRDIAVKWLAEVRDEQRLRVTPFKPGLQLTALDQRALAGLEERSLFLARYLFAQGKTNEAALAYVRLLDRRGWPATPAQGAAVDAYFSAHPETVAALGPREIELLQPLAGNFVTPALVRRLSAEDKTMTPATLAARFERVARIGGDTAPALEAAYIYKGDIWEDYADADALLRVVKWMLGEPTLRTEANRLTLARTEALGLALQFECSSAALEAARKLSATVDEGAYAEILLLSFGRGHTRETESRAKELIDALEERHPDFQPWDKRLGAPTPRALRALTLMPLIKTLDEAKAAVGDLEGSEDPWVGAFLGHLLVDERRTEDEWVYGRLLIEAAATKHRIRFAAADVGALMFFGKSGYIKDPEAALSYLILGTEAGYETAAYALGLYYYQRSDEPGAASKALALLRRVEDEQRLDAQLKCAQLLLNGKLGAPNWVEAEAFARSAAEQGDASAQYLLGKMIVEDRIPGRPASVGIDWWKKAWEQKYIPAALSLYTVKMKRAASSEKNQLAEELYNALDEASADEQYKGALLLLDDSPEAGNLGFAAQEKGRELIERLMERRHRGALAYFEAHSW